MYNKQVQVAPGVCVVYTMTATVIVPHKDISCSQWVTFNGDNEPILNNAPPVEEGCDTYLKRLQRSKLYSNSDPALPGNSQFCFEAVVDKRYNRWKRRRRKKKDLEFRQSSVPPASDSSDENEDGRNTAVERIIDRMYDQINGCPPQTPGGSRDTPRIRNRRRRLERKVDVTSDQNSVNYDASSEWTASDKDGAQLSSSSGSFTGHVVRQTPEISETSTFSDELCSWPFLEQYREEMMKRIQVTMEDEQDAMSQNDWLPDIMQHSSGTSKHSEPPEYDGSNGSFTPVEQQPVVSVCNKIGTPVSQSSTPEPSASRKSSGRPPAASFSYSTWSRSDKSTRSSGDEERSKVFSQTSASTWGETGVKPCSAKRVGVISVTGDNLGSTFKAAIRPITHTDIVVSNVPKPAKKFTETSVNRNRSVNLPSLSKNSKSQTVPKLDRAYVSKPPKVSKKPEVQKQVQRDLIPRPKTQPQTTRSMRKTPSSYQNSVDKDLLFRDYYLRSLYNSKGRLNSHINSFNTGSKLKKTLTVDNLDLGNRRNSRKKMEEDNLSNLSFTRSFTFSMFDLPEMYKVYNARLERRANGEEVTESD